MISDLQVNEAVAAMDADISLAAGSDVRVLITGREAAQNEQVARLIHRRSHRSIAPFVCVSGTAAFRGNTFALPLDAIAPRSTLSGRHVGRGGTVLLRNIDRLSDAMQSALWHWLFAADDRPPTESTAIRLMAETSSDLYEVVLHGKFREDLYYRLNTIRVCVPDAPSSAMWSDWAALHRDDGQC